MSIYQQETHRQQELAMFLRSCRERVAPEQVGLPRGERRRTPGLRRGEVATLVGVSTEWYTWLEQARDIHVSVQVLDRLAEALRLDGDERAHLFLLAHGQPPPVATFTPPTVSPVMQQFLDQLGSAPACAVDTRLNILACNKAHNLIFGAHEGSSERERNLVWRLFTSAAPQRNASWEKLARIYLAQFRAGYGRYINDPWWAEQIAALNEISPIFRELWPEQQVLNASEGHKTYLHPLGGILNFDFLWLQTSESADLRLLIHTPSPESTAIITRLMAGEAEVE